MIGIDTPKTSYSYGNQPECYGKQATSKTESVLVAADEIWLEADVGDRDPNGRLLRYVWYISHVDQQAHFLNEELVRDGFALAKTYRPNTKYQKRLDKAERAAISNAAGMWLSCDASVSMNPDNDDPEKGPDEAPIGRTKTPEAVDDEAACSFFDTYDQAQDWLSLFPELKDTIDLDNDGFACATILALHPRGLQMKWTRDSYTLDDDRVRLDMPRITKWIQDSYWAKDRPTDLVKRSWDNSAVVMGLYSDGEQVGCARVLSDLVTTAYLADVFIHPDHRGSGLGVWLVETLVDHPSLSNVRWILHTRDAGALYAKVGFGPPHERTMERPRPA